MTGSLLFLKPPPPGAHFSLHQGKWWVDITGQWLKIDEMSLGHVENVMALLLRRSVSAASMEIVKLDFIRWNDASDGVFWGLVNEIASIQANPERWMKSTRLYLALKARRKSLRKAIKKGTDKS